MPWRQVASGTDDRNVNPADGVGSLKQGPRTHPAHAEGRLVYNGANRDGQNGNPDFKWIKQHLRIKAFYGTSENAVKTHMWSALSVYVLVAIVKKRLALDGSLYKFLQILSITLFEKMPMSTALFDVASQFDAIEDANQLPLFDL